MDDVIEALEIAKKYASDYQLKYPFNASHDELMLNVDASLVSDEDRKRLDELSFHLNEEYDSFVSYRFGSC